MLLRNIMAQMIFHIKNYDQSSLVQH